MQSVTCPEDKGKLITSDQQEFPRTANLYILSIESKMKIPVYQIQFFILMTFKFKTGNEKMLWIVSV